jgi:GT2 family glycosyltransferase
MTEAKIGVVTVTYNSAVFLDGFINSLNCQSYKNWFTYIIDNDSKDSTVADLKSLSLNSKKYQLIVNSDNRGVAAANNQGIEAALAAGCDYVLLVNNDTTFEADLFAKLIDACTTSQRRMSAPKMMYFEPADKIWWGGGRFAKWRMFAGTHEAMDEIDIGQTNNTQLFDYCPTCCLLIHKTVFDDIGLMDEKYFVYYDDTDFGIRAYKAGIDGAYVPLAEFKHKVSGSTGGVESNFALHYMARNRVYYVAKNLGRLHYMAYLLVTPIIYFGRFLLGKMKYSKLKILLSAYADGIKMAASQ